ncbi:MAG: hypothetical protein NTW42_01790 [Deltaproteobacteria bacterium]|nr:hypothetical protein [Deltaproteobacteria bacterium]
MTLINVAGRRAERLRAYQAAAQAVRAANKTIKNMEDEEIAAPLVQAASTGKWSTKVLSSIKDQQTALRVLSHGELAQASEQLENVWRFLPDLGLARAVPFSKTISKETVETQLREKGLDPKISKFVFGARSKKLPGIDTGLQTATNTCKDNWEAIIRRDSQLSLALAVTGFNAAVSGSQPSTQPEISETLSKEILENVRKVLGTEGPAGAANTAEWGLLQISKELSTKAIPAAAQLFRSEYPDAKTAAAAVKISSHLRELLWLSATLKLISWKCAWPQSGEAAALVKAASFPLAKKETATPRVTVAAIAKNTCGSGKEVEVLAIVEKVEIRHETKNKPVTTFTLREPGKQDLVVATVPGFKADVTGAVAGTAVLLTGSCKAGAAGKPGTLQVTRESIMKQRDVSFTDYLKAETYRVYSAVPHALCIQSSWITGVDGPLNPFRYGVTAQGR